MTNEQKDKNSWGTYHLQGKPGNSGWKMTAIGRLIRFFFFLFFFTLNSTLLHHRHYITYNPYATYSTYNTHVAIPALLTTRISQLHKRGTVLCIQSTKIEKCAFTILVAKAAVYFREYRESYSFRLSVSPSYTLHFFNGQR